MGFLRKSRAPVEHPLNAFMAQVTSQPQASAKPVYNLDKVCVCTGLCGCDAILNFTGDSPSRLREATKKSFPPTPPPKIKPAIQRKPLRLISSNTPRKSPIAAPNNTLITTPLKFAHSPLRSGEQQHYDQQTDAWHVIAKAGTPKSIKKLFLEARSPKKTQKVKRKPVLPQRFYHDMPGAFPRE